MADDCAPSSASSTAIARAGVAPGAQVDVLLRPDDIVHDDASRWRAKVAAKAFRGAEFLYTLVLESGTRVMSLVPSHHDHVIGEWIGIRLAIDHVVAFPPLLPHLTTGQIHIALLACRGEQCRSSQSFIALRASTDSRITLYAGG